MSSIQFESYSQTHLKEQAFKNSKKIFIKLVIPKMQDAHGQKSTTKHYLKKNNNTRVLTHNIF